MHLLPHINASLNTLATLLIVAALWAIKNDKEKLHIRLMLTAVGVSAAFLVCYLLHHYHLQQSTGDGSKRFSGTGTIRYIYFAILIPHIILAAAIVPMILRTVYLGLKDRRETHKKWARWTAPLWLYVSVSGVVIYLFLYIWYP